MNNITVAKDGEEALDILFKRNGYTDAITPDLVLLDLNLPKVEGRDVLRHIKKDDKLKRIPVIILSSSSAAKDIHETYGMHANCYIVKPVNVDKLVDVAKTIDQFWFSIVSLPSIEE